MIKLLKIIIPVLLFFQIQIICAFSVDFEEAWKRMEMTNSSLRILMIDQAAALREVESLSHLIPGISVSTGLSRRSPLISYFTDPSNAGSQEIDNWNLSLGVGVNMRLSLNGSVSLENQIKALQLNLILLQREVKIRDLRADLKKLFYQIDAGERTINLQERILDLSQTRLEQIEAQYKKGLRSELELLTAQISVSRDKPALQKAKVDQAKKLITLRQYLGLEPDQPIETEAPGDMEMKSENNITNNLEITISSLQKEISEKNRKLYGRNLRSPSIGLSLSWETDTGNLLKNETWTTDYWEDKINLGLSLSVPIDSWFKGSSAALSLEKQDDSIEKNTINLEDRIRKLDDNVRTLQMDLELSQTNLQVNELNIDLQEQTFEKVRQSYENGRTSLYELDNSRQELQKALVTLEEEKLKMNLLLIELEKILGE